MERAEKKRARGEDDDADAGPAASRATPGEPRVDHAWRRREGHSVDTVLAQGGFVGHRDGFRSNEGGFLGDATGSIIPPIFPSTTYARVGSRMGYDLRHMSTPRHRDVISDQVPHDDDVFFIGDDQTRGNHQTTPRDRDQTEDNKKHPLMYSRPDNPTYTQAESVLASLEGGADAALFGSGMAAVSAVAFATLRAGDRAAVPKNCYFAVRVFFQEWCERYGVDCVLYDCEIKGDLENAVAFGVDPAADDRTPDEVDPEFGDGKCKLLWIETPSNPTWRVTDIRAAAAFARARGAVTCCDATVLTPLLCRPLTLGADLVMHSATKYLNGHSDVVAGAVIGRKTRTDARGSDDAFPKVWDRLLRARSFGGSVLGPFEAWLLLRGMRTLHVRVRAQCATAAALANKLRSHPCVAAVYYPGLETHPGHAVARAQQSSPFSFSANACATTGSNDQKDQKMFGGMLSVRCVGGGKAAVMTTSLTKVWFPATSLGGVESLVEHRKTVEGPSSETPDDLLRLSVGLEHADDLYRDLSQALWDAHGRIMCGSSKFRKMLDARKASEENGR